VGPSSNVYVTGYSAATWGSPLHAHAGGSDIVVVKLNSNGALQWHTFYGSSSSDYGNGIAVGPSSNVHVAGYSYATWGSPLHAHAGGGNPDIVVLKLDKDGAYQ
jgi:hypothetical protein